jgi:hypothetical protein
MPIIPALGRLRQENCEFKASLDYSETLSKKKERKKNFLNLINNFVHYIFRR